MPRTIEEIWADRGEWARREVERWIAKEPTDETAWLELVYSILTVQVSYKIAQRALRELASRGLLDMDRPPSEGDLSLRLRRSGFRFWRTRARWILDNMRLVRREWGGSVLKVIAAFPDDAGLRDYIADNFKGAGMAKASLFCRSVGRGRDLAILDRHVLLFVGGGFESAQLTKSAYRACEAKLRDTAARLGTDVATLDCVLWSEASGYIS